MEWGCSARGRREERRRREEKRRAAQESTGTAWDRERGREGRGLRSRWIFLMGMLFMFAVLQRSRERMMRRRDEVASGGMNGDRCE